MNTFKSLDQAADLLFTIKNLRRVVVQRGGTFAVCSRSKARRLGLKIVARNY